MISREYCCLVSWLVNTDSDLRTNEFLLYFKILQPNLSVEISMPGYLLYDKCNCIVTMVQQIS